MLDERFYDITLPASRQEAGFVYGKMCAELVRGERFGWYIEQMSRLNKTSPAYMALCAERWMGRLPEHYQEQIASMADGAGVRVEKIAQWLYADIAAAEPREMEQEIERAQGDGVAADGHHEHQSPADLIGEGGPMCSGFVSWDEEGSAWVGRNCDWYVQTLCRGTAAVRHRVPGRLACMTVGLMGDIDADTGINEAGLWLHMHTWLVKDEPRAGQSCISWLFWMREALETCATLDDVERFIGQTSRDRGVFLVAVEGAGGGGVGRSEPNAAIFECSRSSYRRVEPWTGGWKGGWAGGGGAKELRLVVTNHCQEKSRAIAQEEAEQGPRVRRAGSTVTRYARVNEILDHAPPEHRPDDLQEILADQWVEMRDTCMSPSLRTIYSAVCEVGKGDVWFASGGVPAASKGVWRRVRL